MSYEALNAVTGLLELAISAVTLAVAAVILREVARRRP